MYGGWQGWMGSGALEGDSAVALIFWQRPLLRAPMSVQMASKGRLALL